MLMIKSLVDISDRDVYEMLISGYESDLYYRGCIETMLRDLQDQNIYSQTQCKEYLGQLFRVKLLELPADSTDIENCDYILK